jgi:hypothetical protein
MTNLEFPNSFTVPGSFLCPVFQLFLDIPLFSIFPRNGPFKLINLSSVSRAKSSYFFRGIGEIFTGFSFGVLGVLQELLKICLGELEGIYCLLACHHQVWSSSLRACLDVSLNQGSDQKKLTLSPVGPGNHPSSSRHYPVGHLGSTYQLIRHVSRG